MDYGKEEGKEEEIYENAKKEGFFKSLYAFLRHPFASTFYIYWHIKDYGRLSQQCTNEINKNIPLISRIAELTDKANEKTHLISRITEQVKQLSQDLNSLDNKNKGLICELGIVTSRNEAYRKKFERYKDKVQKSEEFKQEKVKVDNLRSEVRSLEEIVRGLTEKVKGFDTIYKQQKSVIAKLNREKKVFHEELRREEESFLAQTAENDREESYVYIGGSGRIIGSTPAFREKFDFNNPDYPIKGKMYFKVLQPPKDALDYQEKGKYIYDIKYAFRDPQEITLQTTIVDGKGASRIIQFTKHVPSHIKIVRVDESGQNLTTKDYFYTKVEVYDIGKWEKIGGKLKKIFHIKDGEPEELHEFAEKIAVKRIQDEEKEEKEYNDKMAPVYQGLVSCNPRKWNIDEFLEIEKEKGRDGAEVYLREEYEKAQKMQKQKNELISQIILGVIEHKTKQD